MPVTFFSKFCRNVLGLLLGVVLFCAQGFAPFVPLSNVSTEDFQLLNNSIYQNNPGNIPQYVANAEDAATDRHYIQDHTKKEGGLTDANASIKTRAESVGTKLKDGTLQTSLWVPTDTVQKSLNTKLSDGAGAGGEIRAVTYTGKETDSVDSMVNKLTLEPHTCGEEISKQYVQTDGEGDPPVTSGTSLDTRITNVSALIVPADQDPTEAGKPSLWSSTYLVNQNLYSGTPLSNIGEFVDEISEQLRGGDLKEGPERGRVLWQAAYCNQRIGNFTSIPSGSGNPPNPLPTGWVGPSWPTDVNDYPFPGSMVTPPEEGSPWPFDHMALSDTFEQQNSAYINLSKAIMLIDNKLRNSGTYVHAGQFDYGENPIPKTLKELFDLIS